MEELFELVKAFNRLRDKITELLDRVDLLLKAPRLPEGDYLDEHSAGKFLNISRSTLLRLRSTNAIPFIKIKNKILYHKSDLDNYMKNNGKWIMDNG